MHPPEASVSEAVRVRALALISVVVVLAVSAGNMVNVALPIIGERFGAREGTYGLLVTGYTLSFAVFSVVHGRLSERVGARRLYLFGILVYGLGSALVGALHSIGWMIAVRVLQGVGGAALPSLGALLIARLYPASRRGAAMGVMLACVGVAACVGPFLGGALIQLLRWRAVFVVPGALSLLAFWLGRAWLPEVLDRRAPQPIDVVGATLLGLGVTSLMYGLQRLSARAIGPSPVALLVLGVAALVAFYAWIRRREHPFVPPALLADRRYRTTVTIAFLCQATRMGSVILVPILLHEVEQLAPIWVGLVLLPGAALVALFSRRSGRLCDRYGARLPVVGGSACMVTGNLVMAAFAGVSIAGVTAGLALYGLGFAFIQSPLLSVSSQYVPEREAGVGVGLFMMIFFLGGAFGVALTTTTIELQTRASSPTGSWIGLELGRGAPYSNAVLTLTGLAVVALALTRSLPGRGR